MLKEALSELIEEIIGKEVVKLIELLIGKENISELKLADKMKITVNQTRNMLYRLDSFNLVKFTRKKDKKKGWYIYYWTLDGKRALELLGNMYQEKLELLNKQIKREKEGEFFICEEDKIRFKLETALEYDFKCPECEEVLEKEDNTKRIEKLEREKEEVKNKIEQSKTLEYKEPKKVKKKTKKKAAKKKPKKKATKKKPTKRKAKKATKKRKYSIEKRKTKKKSKRRSK